MPLKFNQRHRFLDKPKLLGATVDWGNPYARGLVGAWLIGPDGLKSSQNLYPGGTPLTWGSGASYTPSNFGGQAIITGTDLNNGGQYPAVNGMAKYSVVAWCHDYFTFEKGSNITFQAATPPDLLSVNLAFTSSNLILQSTYTASDWKQIGFSYNGGTTASTAVQLYVNGQVQTSYVTNVNGSGSYVPDTSSELLTVKGQDNSSTPGGVELVLIYNRDLSAAEFLWHYRNPLALFVLPSKQPQANTLFGSFPATWNLSMSGGVVVGGRATVSPATYFVRKTGSDSNDGLTPATAFLTVGKAIGTSGAANSGLGDTVYIGAGAYRETISIGITSPTTHDTTVIGDVDGAYTGDPGEVRITSYTVSDKSAPTGTYTLTIASKSHLLFRNITWHGGPTGCILSTGTSHNITMKDCVFISGTAGTAADNLIFFQNDGVTRAYWLVERCAFLGKRGCHIVINPTNSASNRTLDFQVKNCLFLGGGGDSAAPIIWCKNSTPASAMRWSMIGINNSTFIGGSGAAGTGMFLLCDPNWPTTSPIYVNNCVLLGGGLYASSLGEVVQIANHIVAPLPLTNVATNANSVTGNTYAVLIDIGQALKQMRMARPFATPMIDSPYLNYGNSSTLIDAPLVDFLNRPRASGPAVTWGPSTGAELPSIGYLERHDFCSQQTGVSYIDNGSSLKMVGPGDQDIHIPVNESGATVSIKVYRTADYPEDRNMPSLTLVANDELGVAEQTVYDLSFVEGGFSEQFNTITLEKFNPTGKGWVTLRMRSEGDGASIVYWDTLTVG